MNGEAERLARKALVTKLYDLLSDDAVTEIMAEVDTLLRERPALPSEPSEAQDIVLRPCPWCGLAPEIITDGEYHVVTCGSPHDDARKGFHDASTQGATAVQAAEEWNHRAVDAPALPTEPNKEAVYVIARAIATAEGPDAGWGIYIETARTALNEALYLLTRRTG
jgi:hypothetical protein